MTRAFSPVAMSKPPVVLVMSANAPLANVVVPDRVLIEGVVTESTVGKSGGYVR